MSVSAGPCLSKAALLWWIFGEILASPIRTGLTWGERALNKTDSFYMLFQYERWHAGERPGEPGLCLGLSELTCAV